ncbi:Ulp1 protease family protein [Abeliophyllum distichum]|uniref:Ulp1 protease family protein n=1 Tax=Abeliophyllum distichum TaxID=126358 RepID=A0ABD1PB61_9LAMI
MYQLSSSLVGRGKDEGMVENKKVVGKRLRVPSNYLSSPFTAGVKRRNFIDGSKIDLFQKVDRVKETEFLKWYSKLGIGVAYELGSVRFTDIKEWFKDVLTDGKWLANDHVDMAMYLLRQRAAMYPKSFRNRRVIMDFAFKSMLDVAQMMKDSCPDNFTLPDYLFNYVHGKSQSNGQPWEGCTHLYIPVLANAHWFAVEVNFSEVNISVRDKVRVQRVDGTVKQKISGDCGVFTIKFIEFLSVGESALLIQNEHISMWRKKLAADLYTQNYDP